MGLFDFLKRKTKEEEPPTAPSIIEGSILLNDDYMIHWTSVLNELRDVWGCNVGEQLGIQEFTWFVNVDGYKIGFDTRRTVIAPEEIHYVAQYTYFWQNAAEEAIRHRAHLAVCIMHTGINPLQENLLFTKVIASVLRHTQSIGFFMPSRYLLIHKDFYLDYANLIIENILPLYNWIFFAALTNESKNTRSYYTIGLKDFNKKEIEIDDSTLPSRELAKLLVDTVGYVLTTDAVLTDGQSIDVTAERTIEVRISKGVYYTEEETVKIVC